MFNLTGSEIIVILLLALVVLGPEKLPDAIRRFSRTYAELKKMGTGFQTELKSALDEPMREMRETAEMVRDAADPDKIAAKAEAERAERRPPDEGEPPIVAEPDEPAVGIADPGPTVADPTPPDVVEAREASADAVDAPAATDSDEPAEPAEPDLTDVAADEDATDGDAGTVEPEVDDEPARPVNRIAAGNSSDSLTAAAAARPPNGSAPSGPAFHSAAPRRTEPEPAGAEHADGDVPDDAPGGEPTEAAIDESSGEAAPA